MRDFLSLCLLTSLAGAITVDQSKQLAGLQDLLVGGRSNVLATCNIVFFPDLVDYYTAQDSCLHFDIGTGNETGNLVTINSDEKNEDLKMLLEMAYPFEEQKGNEWYKTKWVWSGLRKVTNNVGEGYQGMLYDSNDWQWADGSTPGEFENWKINQPDQDSLKYKKKGCNEKPRCYQNQMRINHFGEWDDTYKFKKHPFACDYQGKYIISRKQKTWEEAREACAAAGLHLAKVRSDEELEEMLSAMDYFLGDKDEKMKKWDPFNWVWLGGNDIAKEKKWVWEDGEKIKWKIPWMKKAGNDNSKKLMDEGQDVMALSRSGEVDDSFREIITRPFACQCPGT